MKIDCMIMEHCSPIRTYSTESYQVSPRVGKTGWLQAVLNRGTTQFHWNGLVSRVAHNNQIQGVRGPGLNQTAPQ